jgi:hypothetical protein
MSVLDQIKQKAGIEFRVATPVELERLRSLGMPLDAIEFYRVAMPTRMAEIERVRLWTFSDIILENHDAVPGVYALPCGYAVFASNDSGDAYCFDTLSASGKSAPIVLIAHDLEPDGEKMAREDLSKLAKPIAESLDKFLEGFVAGTLDRKPLYRPFDFGKDANGTA